MPKLQIDARTHLFGQRRKDPSAYLRIGVNVLNSLEHHRKVALRLGLDVYFAKIHLTVFDFSHSRIPRRFACFRRISLNDKKNTLIFVQNILKLFNIIYVLRVFCQTLIVQKNLFSHNLLPKCCQRHCLSDNRFSMVY